MSSLPERRDGAPRPTSALSWPKRWQTVLYFLLLVAFLIATVTAIGDLFGATIGIGTAVSGAFAAVLLALLFWLDRRRQRAWSAASQAAGSASDAANPVAVRVGELRWASPWQTAAWWAAILACSLSFTILMLQLLVSEGLDAIGMAAAVVLLLAAAAAVWLHRIRRRQQSV